MVDDAGPAGSSAPDLVSGPISPTKLPIVLLATVVDFVQSMLPSLVRMGASRLIRFLPSGASSPRIGEPVGDVDVGKATYAGDKVEVELYSGDSVLDPGNKTGEKVTVDKVLAPVTQRECGTIRCIGLNVSGRVRSSQH